MKIGLSRKGPGSLCRLAALLAAGSAVLAAASVELKQGEEQVEIVIGGKPFAEKLRGGVRALRVRLIGLGVGHAGCAIEHKVGAVVDESRALVGRQG